MREKLVCRLERLALFVVTVTFMCCAAPLNAGAVSDVSSDKGPGPLDARLRARIHYVEAKDIVWNSLCALKFPMAPVVGQKMKDVVSAIVPQRMDVVGDQIDLPAELLIEGLTDGEIISLTDKMYSGNENLPMPGPVITVRFQYEGDGGCGFVNISPKTNSLQTSGWAGHQFVHLTATLSKAVAVCPAAKNMGWATRGLLRSSFEKQMQMDGGLQSNSSERYVFPGCTDEVRRVVKVNAHFKPSDLSKMSSPNDTLDRISPPYLEYPFN